MSRFKQSPSKRVLVHELAIELTRCVCERLDEAGEQYLIDRNVTILRFPVLVQCVCTTKLRVLDFSYACSAFTSLHCVYFSARCMHSALLIPVISVCYSDNNGEMGLIWSRQAARSV